jgi:hypothetical protein
VYWQKLAIPGAMLAIYHLHMPHYRFSGPFPPAWAADIGYVLFVNPARQGPLEDDLCYQGECSELISEVPRSIRRQPSLCFVGFRRGQISHVARAEIRYKARSGNDRLDLWRMVELPRPVSVAKLRGMLKGSRDGIARNALKRGGHLPPKAFKSVMEALRRVDPEAFDKANSLFDDGRPTRHPVPEQARENWTLQRDAVVTAMEIAKIPRDSLEVPPQPPPDTPGDANSIFDGVGEIRGLEDILVLHDLNGMEGWGPVRTHAYPARTFESGDTLLTVVLANKLPLEQQIGVDLIYINETLKSVVLVQYKVMRGADGEEGYRPDDQMGKEVQRMDRVAEVLAAAATDTTCDGYRLGGDPFFLKFCKGVLDQQEVGMVPGHYLPLGFWKRLADDPRVRGPKDGVKVTPSNLPRYLTPTDFKELVTRGWIGTTGVQADVIVPLILEIVQSGRTVALAIKSRKPAEEKDSTAEELEVSM